ncbi:MAG: prepilin-type N-terminal cleavage/methylation domain-containing protein [Deltaproteobacteria bacterium]|nr:prepilin-type N-terminal cleavage/methylation domain-containing protein [Deltaproteobacteria bacterium]
MRNKKGFTLIELMIVVAIVGILAAIAIPAYIDYTIKAKISEVANAFDALATAASEYHASMGFWSTQQPALLASLPDRRATWAYNNSDANNAVYIATIANIATAVDGCTLQMLISYDTNTGYTKDWLAASTLQDKYMPRQ